MNVIEKARELGAMLQESEEMKAYKDAEAAQKADEASQAAMSEFNLNRLNLARDMQNGKISREDAVAKNNEAYEELLKKAPLIAEYVEKKKVFDDLVNQVNQIINFYITGSTGGCSGSCNTCGGCS
ncbi:MAG: YlbF family regulator [Oscillospiraceae bacterium]|nr:YlbF family regulator [Oscillospiraceae bacterium]